MQSTDQNFTQFLQLVGGSTGVGQENTDKEFQRQCEQQIKTFAEQNPDIFILYLLQLVQSKEQLGYKQFAASQIRLNLSQFQVDGGQIWDKISLQTKAEVKKVLFSQLSVETSKLCRNLICDAIAEIAATCYEKLNNQVTTVNEFSDFKDILWQMFSQTSVDMIESAYRLLSVYSTLADADFEKLGNELYTLYKLGIQYANVDIQFACLDAMACYVQIVDYKIGKNFESLLPVVIEQIYNIIQKNPEIGEKCLASFHDISDCEPKFFKKNFKFLFTMVTQLYQLPSVDSKIKEQGLELIMGIIQKISSVIRKDKEMIKQTIDMIFLNMINIDQVVEEEWMLPPEGFVDDDEEEAECEKTRDGMNNINIIIENIGEKETLPLIYERIQSLLQSTDWRYIYSAIMALSQVGEFLDEISDVKPILQSLLKFIDHQNCKVRYSICQAIGQISEDMKPEFQENFTNDCVAVLVKLCDDPVQRVQAHALSAFSNLFESVDQQIVVPHLKNLLIKCLGMIQNRCSLVKESAVSAIAAISEAAKLDFEQYYNDVVPILFNMYEIHQTKEYKQLKGNIIECISLIGYGVSEKQFELDFHKLVQILINLQQSELDENDPSTAYIISGWQRLCIKYSQLLLPYLPSLMPKLFEIIKNLIAQFQQEEQNDDLKKVNSHVEDNVTLSLELICVFVEKLKQQYVNYVQETITIISPLVGFQSSEEIKNSACKLIPDLINCVKLSEQPIGNLVNLFIDIFMDLIQTQSDPESQSNFIDVILECFKVADQAFMDAPKFEKFYSQLIELLKNSDSQMIETQKDKLDEDNDEDEIEIIDDDIYQLEELQLNICLLFGQLFKTHKTLSLPLASFLYNNLLPRLVQDNSTNNMHKCGIYLIVDFIEYLGYEMCTDKWHHLLEALLKFCLEKYHVVRQAACYGIGLFAQQTPLEVFKGYTNQILANLQQAHQLPQGEENDKSYGKCQDNVVAALGKIIQFQTANINLRISIDYWLKGLPIKFDKSEQDQQHELFFKILSDSPNQFFENVENYEVVMQILGKMAVQKKLKKENQTKIKHAIQLIQQHTYFRDNLSKIYNALSEQQKKHINHIVNNNE